MSESPKVTCGTYAGWNRHQRLKETTCQDCRVANATYHREYRRRSGSLVQFHFPVTLSPQLMGLSSLGSTLAESFRGSA